MPNSSLPGFGCCSVGVLRSVCRCVVLLCQEDKTSNTAVNVDYGICQLVNERLAVFALAAQELGGLFHRPLQSPALMPLSS